MPATFKLSTLLQNAYAGSATRAPIRHSVPEINASLTDAWSIAAEFTTVGGKTIAIGAGASTITVGGVTQLDPITRVAIVPARVYGFIISVSGPVGGAVTVTSTNFGKITFSGLQIVSGGVLNLYMPFAGNSVATSETLTITPPTAGYVVSFVAYGSSVALP
jgi:hypothetical protein